MKIKIKIASLSLILTVAFAGMGGCDKSKIEAIASPANVRIAAAISCGNVLNFAYNGADRAKAADILWGIAHGVRTTSGGRLLSPEEFKATIAPYSSNVAKWEFLNNSIAGIYGGVYPLIKQNTGRALEYIEAIAAGIEDAANLFKTQTPSPSP